ncbi:hypothetical protein L7F22_029376 [Adiantum nelumboides]|nr:hypothetical protein [Adiantum nelumboides]
MRTHGTEASINRQREKRDCHIPHWAKSIPNEKCLKSTIKALPKQKICIQPKSYWIDPIEEATKMIMNAARNTETKIMGRVPLPTKRHVYCVLRSLHVNKDSREHFDICTHQRLIEFVLSSSSYRAGKPKCPELDIPARVDVEVKLL